MLSVTHPNSDSDLAEESAQVESPSPETEPGREALYFAAGLILVSIVVYAGLFAYHYSTRT